MNMVGGIIGGVIAGAIGAAVWCGITYASGYEVGLIAWGIGLIVGIGVAAGWKGGGAPAGVLAVVISILSILGGKYFAVELLISKELESIESTPELAQQSQRLLRDDELVVTYIADAIIEEKMDAGETVQWPGGEPAEMLDSQEDYPTDVWAQAQADWDSMGADLQADYRKKLVEQQTEAFRLFVESMRGEFAKEGFVQSFSFFDVIFFLLAIATAFRIGASGMLAEGVEV